MTRRVIDLALWGAFRDRESACPASDRQGSNLESCVWREVSSHSSHHPQEALLAQFSLCVHKGIHAFDVGPTLYKCYTNVLCLLGKGLKPHSFSYSYKNNGQALDEQITSVYLVTQPLSNYHQLSIAAALICRHLQETVDNISDCFLELWLCPYVVLLGSNSVYVTGGIVQAKRSHIISLLA